MKIALLQIRVVCQDVAGNFNRMQEALKKSSEAQVVFFPEMALPGYLVGDAWERQSFLAECEYYTQKLVELSESKTIVFGSIGVDHQNKNYDGRVRKYNSFFVAENGNLIAHPKLELKFWPKVLLPQYREFDDKRYFFSLCDAARELNLELKDLILPVEISGTKIGIHLCEDAWSADYGFSPTDFLVEKGAEFLVNLSASPFTLGKNDKRNRIFGAVAKKHKKNVFYVNPVGVQNIGKTVYAFDGTSCAYGADGSIVAQAASYKEDTLILDSAAPTGNFNQFPLRREEQIKSAIEFTVKSCCEEWDIKRVVMGVSGGVDSALSAALMVNVLGKENVLLMTLPSKYNSHLTKNAAVDLAKNLGCHLVTHPIQDGVDLTEKEIGSIDYGPFSSHISTSSLVSENIQARDRGARILAAVSSKLGTAIVCNTNKSELSVGFSTLYGDNIGFLAPLADLWKHDIYKMARFYNDEVFKREVIPQDTLDVVPSPELSAKHDVTKNMGDPLRYEYHDYLIRSWIEKWNRSSPFEILKAYDEGTLEEYIGCEKGIVKKLFPQAVNFIDDLEKWWKAYNGMGVVKRVQAPPIVAVTPRAFGFDLRENIGKVFFGHQYEELKNKLIEKKGI